MSFKNKQAKHTKEDTSTSILETISKNAELLAAFDEISKTSDKRDFEVLSLDKKEFTLLEDDYKKRGQELLKIPNFWSVVFAKVLMPTFGGCGNLLMALEDFSVEDTSEEFRLHFTFNENDILKDKKVSIICKTPTSVDNLTDDMPVTTIPEEFKLKVNPDKIDDPFLLSLLDPDHSFCTMIVGELWKDPLSVYLSEDADENSEDGDGQDEDGQDDE
eukprot:gene15233-18029_t